MWMEVQYADNKAKSDYRGEEKAARQAGVRMTWEEIMEKGECVSMKGLAITGSDLIAAGMKPGKEMGSVLHELLDAVLENPELNKKKKHFLPLLLQPIKNFFRITYPSHS